MQKQKLIRLSSFPIEMYTIDGDKKIILRGTKSIFYVKNQQITKQIDLPTDKSMKEITNIVKLHIKEYLYN